MSSIQKVFNQVKSLSYKTLPKENRNFQCFPSNIGLDINSLYVIDNLLDYAEHFHVLKLLSSSSLNWVLQRNLSTRAASGITYQLASSAEHDKLAMQEIAGRITSAVYKVVSEYPEIREADQIIPQVFPVVMIGEASDPPYQVPHQDSHNSSIGCIYPLLTMVYYLVVDNTCGGSLIGLKVVEKSKISQCFRHNPSTNQLVIIKGSQTHLVEPLWHGIRISIVVNFYRNIS